MQEHWRTEEPGQSFAYEIRGNSAVILRCFSRDTRAEIPEWIGEYQVRALGPYAFSAHMDEKELEEGLRSGRIRRYVPSWMEGEGQETLPALEGNRLEEIALPPSVQRVGKYCFYNCGNLRRISFSGELEDWGSGVFTGCHRVKRILIRTKEDGGSHLKEVLDELREALEVEYFDCRGNRRALLVFPEFYEEGVENTPARILETHVHGSGILYRNCFRDRVFDFRQYDLLFPHAVAQEPPGLLARMTLGRLRLPWELSAHAAEAYQSYVRTHSREIVELLLAQRDLEGIRWLLESGAGEDPALLDYATDRAAEEQYGEGLSFLMNLGRSRRSAGRKRLEL